MIIDMAGSLLGRVATVAAKRALEGEEVILINVEKAKQVINLCPNKQ